MSTLSTPVLEPTPTLPIPAYGNHWQYLSFIPPTLSEFTELSGSEDTHRYLSGDSASITISNRDSTPNTIAVPRGVIVLVASASPKYSFDPSWLISIPKVDRRKRLDSEDSADEK